MGNVMDCGWGNTPNPDELTSANPIGNDIEFRTSIQKSTRLDKSLLWTLQKNYYDRSSLLSWTGETVIPNFVTSNCFIAKCYSDVIFNNIMDIFNRKKYNPQEPIYILELGGGSGKFGFLLVEKLMEVKEFYPATERPFPFVYVMTEISPEMIDFYEKHPQLSALCEQGVLDFALFDSEKDKEITLIKTKRVISAAEPTLNPVIVVGNYLFDSLRQTAYRIDHGEIYNTLCVLETKASANKTQYPAGSNDEQNIDVTSPDLINNLIITWQYEKVEKEQIQEDDEVKLILAEYLKMDEASIVIPVGGFKLIRFLEQISQNQLMLVIGDKGYSSLGELSGHRDPHVALHGSFSFMVNFDSICQFVTNRNGHYISTPYNDGFKVFTYFLGTKPSDVSNTRFAFSQSLVVFGPESFSTLQRCVKEESIPKFKHLQALLRLADGDPDVFYKFRGIIVEQGTNNISPEGGNSDLILDLKRIARSIYPLQKQKDVSFELGRLFMGLKLYSEAIDFFKESIDYCNEHYVTYQNMGVSHYYLQQFKQAQDCFIKSLRLKNTYRDAQVWLEKVEKSLQEMEHPENIPTAPRVPDPPPLQLRQESTESADPIAVISMNE